MSRRQFASLLFRLLDRTGTLDDTGTVSTFSDVDDGTHDAAIADLASAGVILGHADGSFRAAKPITRAQMATVLMPAYAATGGSPDRSGDHFDDDDGSVHERDIDAAVRAGLLQGRGGRRFAPGEPTSRGQAATVVANLLATLHDRERLEAAPDQPSTELTA